MQSNRSLTELLSGTTCAHRFARKTDKEPHAQRSRHPAAAQASYPRPVCETADTATLIPDVPNILLKTVVNDEN